MFDSVNVPCPRCGTLNEFQSKGGDCLLKTYDLDNCPHDVLSDINRHSPNKCDVCGMYFEVEFEVNVVSAKSVEYIYD